MTAWVAALATGGAVLLAWPARPVVARPRSSVPAPPRADRMHRFRIPLALLAGVGAALFLGGPAAPVLAVVSAAVVWVVIGRAEPRHLRRDRIAVERDLPHLVGLLAACLRGGASPSNALRLVCAALPGVAATRLSVVSHHLAVGIPPGEVWGALATDPDLAVLGRAVARSHESGSSIATAVERLAQELGEEARARAEGRARGIGVRAALPLGLCLLPAFLLLGVVPLVAGLLSGITPG